MRKFLLFLFSHRLLAVARWDIHFLRLRLRNFLTGQRRKAATFVKTRQAPVLLNLGAGPRGLADAHWINIDGFPGPNIHFAADVGRPLFFPDASFDGVFCEHVLEHFGLAEGETLAREILRVLRPGGVLRVVVPDAAKIMRAYFDQPGSLMDYRGGGSAMEIVNLFFRQRYEHQFLYDHETLEKMLKARGFADVARLEYGKSRWLAPLAIDDAKYVWESLYVEARKA